MEAHTKYPFIVVVAPFLFGVGAFVLFPSDDAVGEEVEAGCPPFV